MTFLERYVGELKQKYEARESHLRGMTKHQIRLMTNGWLPDDLSHSERIKYILEKEFPSR